MQANLEVTEARAENIVLEMLHKRFTPQRRLQIAAVFGDKLIGFAFSHCTHLRADLAESRVYVALLAMMNAMQTKGPTP